VILLADMVGVGFTHLLPKGYTQEDLLFQEVINLKSKSFEMVSSVNLASWLSTAVSSGRIAPSPEYIRDDYLMSRKNLGL